jgi:hypothetical protein
MMDHKSLHKYGVSRIIRDLGRNNSVYVFWGSTIMSELGQYMGVRKATFLKFDRMYLVNQATTVWEHSVQCSFKQCQLPLEHADNINRNVGVVLTEPLTRFDFIPLCVTCYSNEESGSTKRSSDCEAVCNLICSPAPRTKEGCREIDVLIVRDILLSHQSSILSTNTELILANVCKTTV